MKLVNVQIIKDELERLIRDYRFHSSAEAKYRCEAYKELSEWLDSIEVKDDMDTIHPIEDVVSNDPIANSYKEKYEQALEVAKETYNKQPMYREWLEKMFPELKESEDEKIREALIRFHKSTIDIDGIKGADIISWLEKQGEKKPADVRTTGYWHVEDVEQKPAWSEEEERYICQLESMVKERWALAEKAQDEEVIKNMSNLAFFLKTLNPNKKPADEDMKTLLRTEYEKGRADAIVEMQMEWREKDKDFMYGTLSNLTELKDRYGEGYCNVGKCIDWLKSLRPRNHWKPSEEQMAALNYVVNLMASSESPVDNDYYYNVFKDLRKQLKKLKEEKV